MATADHTHDVPVVVACWSAAPPDPRAALAAAVPWEAEPAGSRR
jgi:hypothetical protein